MTTTAAHISFAALAGAVLALGVVGTASAGGDAPPDQFDAPGDAPPPDPEPGVNPDPDLPDLDVVTPTVPPDPWPDDCVPYDPAAFGITIADNGDGTVIVQIGYFDTEDACNADVHVTSYRTDAAASAAEELIAWSADVNSLEAAALGDGWLETDIAIDPCFAKVEVSVVDGGAPTDVLATEQFGDGCAITVVKEFPDDPWAAGIALIHEPGWTDDHVLDVEDDDTVTWEGLPSGDYVVNEYIGAVAGTTVAIDGGPPAHYPGGDVPVGVGVTVVFTNPAPDADVDPDPQPDPSPEPEPGQDPEQTPDGPLPLTGTSNMIALGAVGLISGFTGLGLVAAGRRRRRR